MTNTKSPNFIEYTDLSKFFLNLYVFLILLICLIHSIYPKIVFTFITEGFGIITSIKGKIILSLAIDIMYYSTDNLPQKLFGMISFVSVLSLFLGDLVLNCEILKQPSEESNNESKEVEISTDNSISVFNQNKNGM